MREKQSIFKEIFQLIEEQREVLDRKLSPQIALKYQERAERIRELLGELGHNGLENK